MYVGLTRARRELRLSWAGARNAGGRATRRPSRFLDGAASVLGEGARSAAKSSRPAGKGKQMAMKVPAKCRGCGADLTTAAERKVGRCADCPPTYDEQTFEALRAWRIAVATASKVPAYVVFTDATLTAIAERRPSTPAELATIGGVGARKLDRYGAAVLAVLGGADPVETAENDSAASESE